MNCKRCGTPLHQGVVICPECGARQRRQASSVRCASCGGRAPVGLTVCPRCGRDVRPAGPRWGIWLAGLGVLVLAGLWGLGELPIERLRGEVSDMRTRLAGLVQVFGPTSGSPTPERTVQPATQVLALAAATATRTPLPITMPPTAQASAETASAVMPALQPTETPAGAASLVPPTATATPAPTATPSPPPTATPTATPPPARPPAAGAPLTYQVKAGDTLYAIALNYNVSVEALMAANRLSSGANLQVGQTLAIPGTGAPPTATPRPQPTAAPTPSPLPATPLPSLRAPVLLNPGDQSQYTGERYQIELKWEPVPGMPIGDSFKYQVVIRWDEQGAPQEYSDLFTPYTEMAFPGWLWGRADQPARRYQWFVRAVQLTTDGRGGQRIIPLSPASQMASFFWN